MAKWWINYTGRLSTRDGPGAIFDYRVRPQYTPVATAPFHRFGVCDLSPNSRSLVRRAFGICAIAVLGAGCATPRFKDPAFPALAPEARSAESTCAETDPDNCALPSPFHTLSEELSAGSTQAVTLLEIGAAALAARIHLIRSARRSIDIQTFIWADDEVGRLMITELLDAARRGVRVRIIADQLNVGAGPARLALLVLAHRNLEVRLYNPLDQQASTSLGGKLRGLFFNFSALNHRMHNKLMVVDGRVAVTGGRNIANKYYDYDPDFNYVDRDVLVVGSVVTDMAAAFETYWQDPIVVAAERLNDVHAELERIGYMLPEGRLELPRSPQFAPLIAQALQASYVKSEFIDTAFKVNAVHYSADRPRKPFLKDDDSDNDTTKEVRSAVTGATTRVTVQTPYFILSATAVDGLKALRQAHPGIEFLVVTNSLASTDQYYVYALSYKRKKRNIDELGFRIFEFNPFPRDKQKFMPRYGTLVERRRQAPAFEPIDFADTAGPSVFAPVPVAGTGARLSIHAKSMVVDGRIGIVGSHNFDPRSVAINTESALIVVDDAFAAALEKNILLAAEPGNAWVAARRETVPLIGHMGRFFATISRALPVFDLWPFRYTSNFELKAGMSPVPPTHPDFYDHYEDVGQFPGTGVGDDQLKTYLVSGFGAVAEPLM